MVATVVTLLEATRSQYLAVPEVESSDLRPVLADSTPARVLLVQSVGARNCKTPETASRTKLRDTGRFFQAEPSQYSQSNRAA